MTDDRSDEEKYPNRHAHGEPTYQGRDGHMTFDGPVYDLPEEGVYYEDEVIDNLQFFNDTVGLWQELGYTTDGADFKEFFMKSDDTVPNTFIDESIQDRINRMYAVNDDTVPMTPTHPNPYFEMLDNALNVLSAGENVDFDIDDEILDKPFNDACALTLDDLHSLLCRKQDDYGSGNILHSIVDPETALLVRLSDKFARLSNLYKKNREAKNETIRDTVVDIAGYATLLLMVIDGTFPE